jgi:hypothetical protein
MVTIAAVDSMGREGDSTTPITVITDIAAPSPPQMFRIVDFTSCQLDWLPPASPNGPVMYTVQYQTSSGGSFMDVATGLTTTQK